MSLNIDVYSPGTAITGRATTEVTAKRFVKISGDRANGNIAVAHADAGGRVFGVASTDAEAATIVTIARGAARVVKVTAGGPITAFAEVEVGTDGKAVTKDEGVAVGYAVTGTATDADAQISLY